MDSRPLTQDVHVKRRSIFDNRVTGVVSTLCATAQLDAAAGDDIDDFALAFITPLRAEDDGRHDLQSIDDGGGCSVGFSSILLFGEGCGNESRWPITVDDVVATSARPKPTQRRVRSVSGKRQ
jgi:hypothetical protein